jgi:tripartite-type tricarboxylate transporter receptor subunit TctC
LASHVRRNAQLLSFAKVSHDPETISKLYAQGLFPIGECGEAAVAFTKKQFENYGRMIKEAEIR